MNGKDFAKAQPYLFGQNFGQRLQKPSGRWFISNQQRGRQVFREATLHY